MHCFCQGVGYPLDIVVCSALGADMYDCVYPTRTARFGTALVPEVMISCYCTSKSLKYYMGAEMFQFFVTITYLKL